MNIGEENLKKTADRLGLTIEQIPRSIAIIMDGNGRWAQQKGLLRVAGHHKGGKTVEQIVLDCVDLGIEVLTMYTFSIENWKRPKAEVNALMKLYTKHLVGIRNVMMENNVRLIHLGRSDNLPKSLKAELDKSVEMTTGNDGMVLGLALNYGGRSEIVDAAKKIAIQMCKDFCLYNP